MAPQMARGVLTEASSKAVAEECASGDILAARVSEHAAQVIFLAFSFLPKCFAFPYAAFTEDFLLLLRSFWGTVSTSEFGRQSSLLPELGLTASWRRPDSSVLTQT